MAFLTRLRPGEEGKFVLNTDLGNEAVGDDVFLKEMGLDSSTCPRNRGRIFRLSAAPAAFGRKLTSSPTLDALDRGRRALFRAATLDVRKAKTRLTVEPKNRGMTFYCASRLEPKWLKVCDRAMCGGLYRALDKHGLFFCAHDEDRTADWSATRPETLAEFLQVLAKLRSTAIAEAGMLSIASTGFGGKSAHHRCAPWRMIQWWQLMDNFIPSAMKSVGIDEEPFARRQSRSGLKPSLPADDRVRRSSQSGESHRDCNCVPVFFKALMMPSPASESTACAHKYSFISTWT